MSRHEHIFVDGPDGRLEVFVEPQELHQGIALISHPHPLFGGTADNKVVTTLARAFRDLGCVTLRPSFRGVGGSEGAHDHGGKETRDQQHLLDWAHGRYGLELPVYLAGFSFGAYVTTLLARRLADEGRPARRLVLVGTVAGFIEGARHYETPEVARDTLVIHGERDDIVPLANVLAWAEPQELPVTVIPGADHFFHRKLPIIRDLVTRGIAGTANVR
ncbi:alpha/beta hydrolase [Methylococcus sp. EFPC2]|uniref:alpha/beta hydrolase n=1 Tax=Methylococcus sp. EFPC2 TaxID=2812648 RepID=UPI001967B5A4|nr:alpha/beta family hydrolase [Methylococcus sp. EFPC2]QSA97176.1 hydrolase [Methylococcus sp. EFPC2]